GEDRKAGGLIRVGGLGLLSLCACAALAAGCGAGSDGERPTVVVAAAASLSEALRDCAEQAGERLGAEVRFSFAGSDELAAQIRQGVPVDVFAAANAELPRALHAAGLLDEPVEFATNELVLAARRGGRVGSLQDAAAPGVVLAVGSESVPV